MYHNWPSEYLNKSYIHYIPHMTNYITWASFYTKPYQMWLLQNQPKNEIWIRFAVFLPQIAISLNTISTPILQHNTPPIHTCDCTSNLSIWLPDQQKCQRELVTKICSTECNSFSFTFGETLLCLHTITPYSTTAHIIDTHTHIHYNARGATLHNFCSFFLSPSVASIHVTKPLRCVYCPYLMWTVTHK